MKRGLNKVLLIGRVNGEPETRRTPSGRAVTTFSVSTPHSWISAEGERQEESQWFNVVTWGKLAERCSESLDDGQQVYVEGRLQTRSWEDGEGRRHVRTEVVAQEMILLTDSP